MTQAPRWRERWRERQREVEVRLLLGKHGVVGRGEEEERLWEATGETLSEQTAGIKMDESDRRITKEMREGSAVGWTKREEGWTEDRCRWRNR